MYWSWHIWLLRQPISTGHKKVLKIKRYNLKQNVLKVYNLVIVVQMPSYLNWNSQIEPVLDDSSKWPLTKKHSRLPSSLADPWRKFDFKPLKILTTRQGEHFMLIKIDLTFWNLVHKIRSPRYLHLKREKKFIWQPFLISGSTWAYHHSPHELLQPLVVYDILLQTWSACPNSIFLITANKRTVWWCEAFWG